MTATDLYKFLLADRHGLTPPSLRSRTETELTYSVDSGQWTMKQMIIEKCGLGQVTAQGHVWIREDVAECPP